MKTEPASKMTRRLGDASLHINLLLLISLTLLSNCMWVCKASADDFKILDAQSSRCGMGQSPPHGVYYDQKYCEASAWLVNKDTGKIYLCSAQHAVSNVVQGNKVIEPHEQAAASCSQKYTLPPGSTDNFAAGPPPIERPDGMQITPGWANIKLPGTVVWSAARSNFNVTACLGMPGFSTCVPATIK